MRCFAIVMYGNFFPKEARKSLKIPNEVKLERESWSQLIDVSCEYVLMEICVIRLYSFLPYVYFLKNNLSKSNGKNSKQIV